MRNNLLWILPIFFFIVLSFSIVPTYRSFQKEFKGDAENISYPGFNKPSLVSHTFQQYVEKLFEQKIRFRHHWIAANNQLYYSLFHKSFSDDNQLIIGKHNQLFELHYIQSYCQKNINNKDLITWADNIKKIHDMLTAKGKVFLYIITPSKAEYMPDMIPHRFHCNNRGIKPEVYELDRLLTERDIPHINGPDLMTRATKIYNMPMFNFGGIHWSSLGAVTCAQKIVNLIQQKIPMSPISFTYSIDKVSKLDSDNDLLKIADVWRPKKIYNVPHIHFEKTNYSGKSPSLSIIGGSFNENLIKLFAENHEFSKIDYYRYFKHRYDEELNLLSGDIEMKKLLQADVIILEENSSMLISDHGKQFYSSLASSRS